MSRSRKPINSVLAVGLCAAVVAGCGGGSASVTSAAHSRPRSPTFIEHSAKVEGNVTFALQFTPKKAAAEFRKPEYVSPSTQSLQILTDAANPAILELTPWSSNCSPNPVAAGSPICTASLDVSAGNHVFTLTAYDQTGGTGGILSTNSTGAVNVKATGTTTIPLVLEGVVHFVILTLATIDPPDRQGRRDRSDGDDAGSP